MSRRKCISCNMPILKSGLEDPYQCRTCESISEDRFAYLDRKAYL